MTRRRRRPATRSGTSARAAAIPRRSRGASAAPAPPARRRSSSTALAVIIAILVVLGLVMVLSASSVTSLHTDGSAWTYFVKQAVWTVLGVGALLVTCEGAVPLLAPADPGRCSSVRSRSMVAVLVPGIGVTVNGARAWSASATFASSRPSC